MPIDIVIPKHWQSWPLVPLVLVNVGGGQGVLINSIYDVMKEGGNEVKFCYWRVV